eukprot:scaffold115_cov172-Amphora_coffeaeformis.AAC.5
MTSKEDTHKEQDEEEIPPLPEGWTRCHVYMRLKRRYCRQQVLSGSLYCGNHQTHDPERAIQQLRIPCPLDSSHLVLAHKVQAHVVKCPSAKKQRQVQEASYFRRDVNKGGHGSVDDNEYDPSVKAHDLLAWAQNIALTVLRIHQGIFAHASSNNVTDPKALTLQDIQNALVLEDCSPPELEAGLEATVDAHRFKSGGPKHLHQQASLVGQLRRLGALPEASDKKVEKEATLPQDNDKTAKRPRTTPHIFFEMGAGRGMLGLVAAGVSAGTQPTNLVLVERSGSRGKADTVLRNLPPKDSHNSSSYLNLHDLKWSRIQCDLAHVHMATVLEETSTTCKEVGMMHVIAKHLCGVGTDLALKALEPIKDQVSTCLFATCCHGVCNWHDYVGRDYLRQVFAHENISFSGNEFELLRRWSGGAVLSNNHSKEGDPDGHPVANCNDDDKEEDARSPVAIGRIVDSLGLTCGAQGLGRCCQRLIDHGRREYLQQVLFTNSPDSSTNLVHYVLPDVTPQNAVILGRKYRSQLTRTTK